jgi:hypothetical protein
VILTFGHLIDEVIADRMLENQLGIENIGCIRLLSGRKYLPINKVGS